MAKVKTEGIIDKVRLTNMLLSGKSGKDCAQFFGVTPSAISHMKKALKITIIRTAGLEKTHEVLTTHLDMMTQLRNVNEAINTELARARDDVENSKGADKKPIQEIIIKLSAEIRKQLDLQLSIAQVWHDVKIYAEFQEEVLNVLAEMSPEARDAVVLRLKQRRILRGAIALD